MHVGRIPIPIVALISWISSFLPVVVGWKRWKSLGGETRILLALLTFYVFFLVVELATTFMAIRNLWLADTYTLLEFVVLAVIYYRWFTNDTPRKAVKYSIGAVVILWMIGKVSFEPLGGNSNYLCPLETVLLIVMALSTVLVLVNDNVEMLFRRPQFWVSIGLITCGAGTLPLFALSTKLLSLPLQEYQKIWNINWILQSVCNLTYTVAFLCRDYSKGRIEYGLVSAADIHGHP